MPKLICITGKAGSGKDTMADRLWENHGFVKIALADPLRLAASAAFGVGANFFFDREKKEEVMEYWGMSPRTMLQKLGTEAVKGTFGEDVWLKRWYLSFAALKDTDHIVVPDVRFELEADFFRRIGGTIVHLSRPGAGLAGAAGLHSSEQGVAVCVGDIEVTNVGTLQHLFETTDDVVGMVEDRENRIND
jgi:hypothetical protein